MEVKLYTENPHGHKGNIHLSFSWIRGGQYVYHFFWLGGHKHVVTQIVRIEYHARIFVNANDHLQAWTEDICCFPVLEPPRSR